MKAEIIPQLFLRSASLFFGLIVYVNYFNYYTYNLSGDLLTAILMDIKFMLNVNFM